MSVVTYDERMRIPFTSATRHAWSLVTRHKVLSSVLVVLAIALLGFGAYIGFAQIVVVLIPIALIAQFVVWRAGRRGQPSHAAEARLMVAGVLVGTVVTGLVIQAVPYGRDHTNPPVVSEPEWANPETRELMVRACFGCHSNEVKYPGYASVAPISWMVQSHVDEGRDKVNYSDWGSGRRGDDTIEVIEEGSMPPPYYTRFGLHPESKLTDAEMQTLLAGLRATPGMSGGGRDRDGNDD